MNPHTVLCVDDEPNILNALRRVFRKENYRLLTATSAKKGLELITAESVALVISDYRMPEMTGVELLKAVKSISPNIIRIVLSGYTDFNAVSAAINEGNVYKFITKPWNDDDLRITVRHCLQQYDMEREIRMLNSRIAEQNEQLRALNRDLEQKVEERTRDLVLRNQVLLLSQTILENLPVAVMGISEDGMIVQINKMVPTIFGNPQGGWLGLNIADVLPGAIVDLVGKSTEEGKAQRLQDYPIDGRLLHIESFPVSLSSHNQGTVLVSYTIS